MSSDEARRKVYLLLAEMASNDLTKRFGSFTYESFYGPDIKPLRMALDDVVAELWRLAYE